eukprot:scaffold64437_cov32-Tisochrysis_lutea.AAC.2
MSQGRAHAASRGARRAKVDPPDDFHTSPASLLPAPNGGDMHGVGVGCASFVIEQYPRAQAVRVGDRMVHARDSRNERGVRGIPLIR